MRATWAASAVVALIGLAAPSLFYGEGARGAGPLFWPLGIVLAIGSLAVKAWLYRLYATGPVAERPLRLALFVANFTAAVGGAGAIALHVTRVLPIGFAVVPLVVSVAAAAIAAYESEVPRVRAMVRQALVLTVGTALVSAFALAALYVAWPALVPDVPLATPLALPLLFLLALPLDPLRQAVVDRIAAAAFTRPLAVREMSLAVEQEEVRADQAERLAELGRMGSAVAHELRNPLGVVLAETKLLEREGASPEALANIRDEVARAKRFLDDLLRYARPRPLETSSFDVRESVRRGIARAVGAIGAAPERVAFDAPEAETVCADAEAVADIVANLVTNALIATLTERDDELAQPCVRITLVPSVESVAVVVDDDGPGIPAEIAPRLFTAFTTGRGRDAAHPGTGLGLAISARLAARQGGSLRHEKKRATGARFTATFPRRAP